MSEKREREAADHQNRGVSYADKGDYQAAIREYNRALEVAPSLTVALYNRGIAFLRTKQYRRAIEDLTQVIQSGSPMSDGAYFNRGSAYFEMKDYDAAIADFTKTIESAPAQSEIYRVYALRGSAYASKGMFDAAIDDLTKGIELNRESDERRARTCYNRAGAFLAKGMYKEAAEDFRKAVTLSPDPELVDSARKHLGELHSQGVITLTDDSI
jgi:tetratricopeptide (TPR) repeat protein